MNKPNTADWLIKSIEMNNVKQFKRENLTTWYMYKTIKANQTWYTATHELQAPDLGKVYIECGGVKHVSLCSLVLVGSAITQQHKNKQLL